MLNILVRELRKGRGYLYVMSEKTLNLCVVFTVPGPPVGILFPEVRTTSVRLIWQSPAQPNGIILG